jgi:MFS family permease
MDGITYAVAFVLILAIRYKRQTTFNPEEGGAWQRIRTGFDYLRARPRLLLFGVMSYGVFVTVLVQDRILLPEYVRLQLQAGADVFASSDMLFAAGALFSGVITRRLFGKRSPVAAVSLLMLLLSLGYVFMAFNTSIRYLFLFSFFYGYVNTGVRIMRVTYLFNTVSNDKIGRILSFFKVADTTMRGLFIALFTLSFFHEENNIRFGYLVFGIFILLCGLFIIPTIKPLTAQLKKLSHEP